jgi:hypothetical protein
MYLFTRQARLAVEDALDCATSITARAAKVSGNDVQLWATTLSPGFGTVTWTSWWADLGSMESSLAKLFSDDKYIALAGKGAQFISEGIDDALYQSVYDGVGEGGVAQYVGSVQADCASGSYERAMTNVVEIAQKAESITGLSTLFIAGLTGKYGGVGWLTGYESLAAFETAQSKLNADPSWLKFIDGATGCYAQDVGVTQSSLYTKVA